MRRALWLVLVATLLMGSTALAQTALVPRAVEVAGGTLYLLDNNSEVTGTSIGILFSGSAALETSDIVAFGGGAVTKIVSWGSGAFIYVDIAAGGTLQISLTGDNSSAKILMAWIRE